MLEYLSEQVRECLRHAEDCARRAKVERDPATQQDFLEMEWRWLSLARSYQFSDQLDAFSKHNNKRRTEADDALKKLTEAAERAMKESS